MSDPARKRLIAGTTVAVAFVAAAGVWFATFGGQHLVLFDAFDYAQIGHQISSGFGFSTLELYPKHVPWLSAHGYLEKPPPPNLYRFPLTPLADASAELLVRDAERGAILQSGIWFLLSIPAVYVLAQQFLRAELASGCALIFASQSLSWATSRDGLTESLATLLVLTTFIISFAQTNARWRWAVLGLACGLAYLCRTQLLFLLPWAVFFGVFEGRPRGNRWIGACVVVAVAITVVAPWMARNTVLAGSPTFSFFNSRNLEFYTVPFTDPELDPNAPVGIVDAMRANGPAILHKFTSNVWPHLLSPFSYTATTFQAALLVLIVVAILGTLRPGAKFDSRSRLLLLGTLAAVGCNFVIVCTLALEKRYFVSLNGVLIVGGAVSLVALADQVLPPNLVEWIVRDIAFVALAICALLFVRRLDEELHAVPDKGDRQVFESFGRLARGGGAVASDLSYKVALYAHRMALQLPSDPRQLLAMNGRYLPIKYVLISGDLMRNGASKWNRSIGYDRYAPFLSSPEFERKYACYGTLEDGSTVFRFRGTCADQDVHAPCYQSAASSGVTPR